MSLDGTKLNESQFERYLDNDTSDCPICGKITGARRFGPLWLSVERPDTVLQENVCEECGSIWHEIFQMVCVLIEEDNRDLN